MSARRSDRRLRSLDSPSPASCCRRARSISPAVFDAEMTQDLRAQLGARRRPARAPHARRLRRGDDRHEPGRDRSRSRRRAARLSERLPASRRHDRGRPRQLRPSAQVPVPRLELRDRRPPGRRPVARGVQLRLLDHRSAADPRRDARSDGLRLSRCRRAAVRGLGGRAAARPSRAPAATVWSSRSSSPTRSTSTGRSTSRTASRDITSRSSTTC